MKAAIFLLAVTLSFCITLEAQAGTFFVDDFDDEPAKFLEDGEQVNWGTGATGRKDRGGGNLVLTVLPGAPYSSAFVPVDPYEDISLRTQFRMDSTSVVDAGVTARWAEGSFSFYYASLEPTGRLRLSRVISGQSELLNETVLPGIDATTADVNMQFDLAGDFLSVTAWAEGSPRPDTAQLSVEDSVLAGGRSVGVWMGGGTGTTTTYRSFEAIPEPSAAILLLAGFATAAVIRPRPMLMPVSAAEPQPSNDD